MLAFHFICIFLIIATVTLPLQHAPTLVCAANSSAGARKDASEQNPNDTTTATSAGGVYLGGQWLSDNATIPELFIAHLKANLAPFWVLIPQGAKDAVADEFRMYYNATRAVLDTPLLRPVKQTIGGVYNATQPVRASVRRLWRRMRGLSREPEEVAAPEEVSDEDSTAEEEIETITSGSSTTEIDGVYIGDQLLPADASIADMFVAQIKADLAPFLLLVPPPVKRFVAAEAKKFHSLLSGVIDGAVTPFIAPARKLLSNLIESVRPMFHGIGKMKEAVVRRSMKLNAVKEPPSYNQFTRSNALLNSNWAEVDSDEEIIELD